MMSEPRIPSPLPLWERSTASLFAKRSGEGGFSAGARRPRGMPSIIRMPRCSWKRNGITHVGKARHISERALEAEAEARMRHGTVATEIPVPGVVLLVDALKGHARVQNIEAFFALAAADDLADAWRQHIHGRNGLAVVVHPHVEGFDV